MFITQLWQKGKNSIWRYSFVLLWVLFWMMVALLPLQIVFMIDGGSADPVYDNPYVIFKFIEEGLPTFAAIALLLFPFLAGLMALVVGVVLIHRRPFNSILTTLPSLRWGRIIAAFSLWAILLAITELLIYGMLPDLYAFNLSGEYILPSILAILILVPAQSLFEEAIFRGYLLQAFALLFRYRWVAILLSALLFGFAHLGQFSVGSSDILPTIYFTSVGILLAALTIIDKGTELAIGMHVANNLYAALVVNTAGAALQTPSLFETSGITNQIGFVRLFVCLAFFLLFLLLWFKWEDKGVIWRSIGPKKVEEEVEEEEY